MENIVVKHKLTISQAEAANGTRKLLTIKSKPYEVIIPAGTTSGTILKPSGTLNIADGYIGDILVQIKVKNRSFSFLGGAIISLLTAVVIFFAVRGFPAHNPGVIYDNGGILVGEDNQPLKLVNNHDAVNPAYAELISFIEGDTTDTRDYVEGVYTCGDFAETLHNNAEAAGIRTAFVNVNFAGDSIGHALNAFETTDRGLVFIDCTGGTYYQSQSRLIAGDSDYSNHDKIAYIETGKELGVIPLNLASSTEYSFYEEYESRVQQYLQDVIAYNDEVQSLNKAVAEKTISYRDYLKWSSTLDKKEAELRAMEQELFPIYTPLGIVSTFNIHW